MAIFPQALSDSKISSFKKKLLFDKYFGYTLYKAYSIIAFERWFIN